ncbi:MAG: hypothetical protein LBS10_04320 [Gracilibacteraceae bacterium]|jgi:hypothetical protein|nr:hypothetical protein [Gracilibacteraceae bacterium]
MFENILNKWLDDLGVMVIGAGSDGKLGMTLEAFNSTLYTFVKNVMETVILPVAYVILALFLVLELHKASMRADGAGGGIQLSAEIVFRVLFKLIICKFAVDSSLLIMDAMYNVSLHLTAGIRDALAAEVFGPLDPAHADTGGYRALIEDMNLGEQLGFFIELFFIRLIVQFVLLMVNVIVIGRFIEIFLYIAVAPIPLATFPHEELSGIGKNFLKNFAAICLQGAMIYLALSFYPLLFNDPSQLWTGDLLSVFALVGYPILLAIVVFNCKGLAKSICNAA